MNRPGNSEIITRDQEQRMHSILDEQINQLTALKSSNKQSHKAIQLKPVTIENFPTFNKMVTKNEENDRYVGNNHLSELLILRKNNSSSPISSIHAYSQNQTAKPSRQDSQSVFVQKGTNEILIDCQSSSSPSNKSSHFSQKENVVPYSMNVQIDPNIAQFDKHWSSVGRTQTQTHQEFQSQRKVLQDQLTLGNYGTPESIKNIQFPGSAISKGPTINNDNTLLQSSLRGALFGPNTRDELQQKYQPAQFSAQMYQTADHSYSHMQTNLKSLQDKIKDLETKLTKVKDHDESSILIQDKTYDRSMRESKVGILVNVKKDQITTFEEDGDTSSSFRRVRSTSKQKSARLRNYKDKVPMSRDSLSSKKKLNNSRQGSVRKDRRLSNCQMSSIKRCQSVSKSKHRMENPSFFYSVGNNSSFIRGSSQKNRAPSILINNPFPSQEDVRKLRDELLREKKKNHDQDRQLEQFKKSNRDNVVGSEKHKALKRDYKQLLEAFEKSEKIRKDQKELIYGLKKELTKTRRDRDDIQQQAQLFKKSTLTSDFSDDEAPVKNRVMATKKQSTSSKFGGQATKKIQK